MFVSKMYRHESAFGVRERAKLATAMIRSIHVCDASIVVVPIYDITVYLVRASQFKGLILLFGAYFWVVARGTGQFPVHSFKDTIHPNL